MCALQNKKLRDYEVQIRECVKCGLCQAHCPTYRFGRREGDVARGKLRHAAALLDNELSLTARVQADISMCLMCGSCMDACPNSIPTHEIVGAMRRQITEESGLSGVNKMVSKVLGKGKLMRGMAKAGAFFSPLLLKKIPETSGLRLRFPLLPMQGRTFPALPSKTLFDLVPEFSPGDGQHETVGFFAGCSLTYLYPETGAAVVAVLQKLGYGVHVPRTQQCCGMPALSAGAGETVVKLADANIASFGKYQESHIITACASCFGGLNSHYATMGKMAEDFAHRVVDFDVFLLEELCKRFAAMPKGEKRVRVTYHDPCHLRIEGITVEPRRILQALPNVEFVEMTDADLCCGLGGIFSVKHYGESAAIGQKKVEGIAESGAELVVTCCPGCIMQLQDSINHAGLHVRAVHLMDLVQDALQQVDERRLLASPES